MGKKLSDMNALKLKADESRVGVKAIFPKKTMSFLKVGTWCQFCFV